MGRLNNEKYYDGKAEKWKIFWWAGWIITKTMMGRLNNYKNNDERLNNYKNNDGQAEKLQKQWWAGWIMKNVMMGRLNNYKNNDGQAE